MVVAGRGRSSWALPIAIVGAAMVTVVVLTVGLGAKRLTTSRPPKGKQVVSHLTVHCRDLKKSLEFYLAIGFLKVSGTRDSILLSLPKGLQYAPYLLLKQNCEDVTAPIDWQCTMAGYGRIALLVPSIIRSSNHLKNTLGVESIAKPVTDTTTNREGQPLARLSIGAWQDPDGTVVELVETHDASTPRFLSTMNTLGLFRYPIWIHCNINATNFKESCKAYQQLGFQPVTDYGRVKNKLYQALGISYPGIARQVTMMKTPDDVLQVDLIEWEDPKTVVPKGGLRLMGLARMALVSPKDSRIDRVPVGWESEGAAQQVSLPSPLGQAKVKVLRDPNGSLVEMVEFQ